MAGLLEKIPVRAESLLHVWISMKKKAILLKLIALDDQGQGRDEKRLPMGRRPSNSCGKELMNLLSYEAGGL